MRVDIHLLKWLFLDLVDLKINWENSAPGTQLISMIFNHADGPPTCVPSRQRRPPLPDLRGQHDPAVPGGKDGDGQVLYHGGRGLGQGHGRQWAHGECIVCDCGVKNKKEIARKNFVISMFFFLISINEWFTVGTYFYISKLCWLSTKCIWNLFFCISWTSIEWSIS